MSMSEVLPKIRQLSISAVTITNMELAYNCGTYTFAAAGEYWFMDWLSSLYEIRLPIFSAMLQNASWPIQGVFYWRQRKIYEEINGPREITTSMYKSYAILGLLNTIISVTRTVGLTTLPPTLYVVIANTEIIFEALMSAAILKRPPNMMQITAIFFVLSGVMISLYDPVKGKFGSNQNVSQSNLILGVFLSLLSRMTSSLNTVLADR